MARFGAGIHGLPGLGGIAVLGRRLAGRVRSKVRFQMEPEVWIGRSGHEPTGGEGTGDRPIQRRAVEGGDP